MIEYVIAFALMFATLTDFKSREIPNWITYPLILLAIITATNLTPIFLMFVFYLGGSFMYHKKWMGGGDVKLLVAMVGLIEITYLIPFFLCFAAFGILTMYYFKEKAPMGHVFLISYLLTLSVIYFA